MDKIRTEIEGIKEDIKEIKQKINKLEEWRYEHDLSSLKNLSDLKIMITDAVKEGNEPILKIVNEHTQQITKLENAEAQKALEEKKSNRKQIWSVAISVIVTFFVSILLNNLGDILTYMMKGGV